MQHTLGSTAEAASSAKATKFTLVPVIGALVLGLVILYGVGFANMEVAHNAAHDARHAFAFPCH
jgi:cobalt transporter subunit CbtB